MTANGYRQGYVNFCEWEGLECGSPNFEAFRIFLCKGLILNYPGEIPIEAFKRAELLESSDGYAIYKALKAQNE